MTTILWDAKLRRLYADTRFYKGEEAFESMQKVRVFRDPFRLQNDPVGWPSHTPMDDVIFGWVHTGAKAPAEALVLALARQDERKLKPDLVIAAYEMAASAALINETNLFEVILFGKKHLHRFRLDTAVGFHYEPRGLDEPFGLGSGGMFGLLALKRGASGYRAMLEALYCDELSGGLVEMWGFDEDKEEPEGLSFRCLGLFAPKQREDIPRYLADPSLPALPFMMNTAEVVRMVEDLKNEKQTAKRAKRKPSAKPSAAPKARGRSIRKAAPKKATKAPKPPVKKK